MRRFVVRSAFEVSNLHLCIRNSPNAGTSRVLRRHLRVSHIPKLPSVCASSVDPEATPECISLKHSALQHISETRTLFFNHVTVIVWKVWLHSPKAPFHRVWLPSRRRLPAFPGKSISTSNALGLDPTKFFSPEPRSEHPFECPAPFLHFLEKPLRPLTGAPTG